MEARIHDCTIAEEDRGEPRDQALTPNRFRLLRALAGRGNLKQDSSEAGVTGCYWITTQGENQTRCFGQVLLRRRLVARRRHGAQPLLLSLLGFFSFFFLHQKRRRRCLERNCNRGGLQETSTAVVQKETATTVVLRETTTAAMVENKQ
ncbi:Uncharacterized protein Rs2_29681 [Raphanus sativus]|nr:Uncharacterized protein Rs2_29681 [Raphanus sativus]